VPVHPRSQVSHSHHAAHTAGGNPKAANGGCPGLGLKSRQDTDRDAVSFQSRREMGWLCARTERERERGVDHIVRGQHRASTTRASRPKKKVRLIALGSQIAHGPVDTCVATMLNDAALYLIKLTRASFPPGMRRASGPL
jgi:hypothetical protein